MAGEIEQVAAIGRYRVDARAALGAHHVEEGLELVLHGVLHGERFHAERPRFVRHSRLHQHARAFDGHVGRQIARPARAHDVEHPQRDLALAAGLRGGFFQLAKAVAIGAPSRPVHGLQIRGERARRGRHRPAEHIGKAERQRGLRVGALLRRGVGGEPAIGSLRGGVVRRAGRGEVDQDLDGVQIVARPRQPANQAEAASVLPMRTRACGISGRPFATVASGLIAMRDIALQRGGLRHAMISRRTARQAGCRSSLGGRDSSSAARRSSPCAGRKVSFNRLGLAWARIFGGIAWALRIASSSALGSATGRGDARGGGEPVGRRVARLACPRGRWRRCRAWPRRRPSPAVPPCAADRCAARSDDRCWRGLLRAARRVATRISNAGSLTPTPSSAACARSAESLSPPAAKQ